MRVVRLASLAVAGLLGATVLAPPLAPATEHFFSALRAKQVLPPEPMPQVTVPTANGGSLNLAELRGKAVLVGFFHTT